MEPTPQEKHPTVQGIVDKIKADGVFDSLRKECLADVDTKPAYQNLKQKVENYCARFLSSVTWSSSLNKNNLREKLRNMLNESPMLQNGVTRIINQVITPKVDKVFKPKVAKVVGEYLDVDPDALDDEEEYPQNPEIMYNVPPPPMHVSLYPFNPFEPPPPAEAPPPLPGFDDPIKPPLPEPPPLPPDEEEDDEADEREQDDDMEISDQSDGGDRKESKSTKTSDADDMECSDEEGEENDDLTKGLAGYMADGIGNIDNHDIKDQIRDNANITVANIEGHSNDTPSDMLTDVSPTSQVDMKASKKNEPASSSAPISTRRESRRHRTRNKKYFDDDFTSIFTEKKDLLSEAYSESYVEEEIITTDDMNQVIIADNTTSEIALNEVPSIVQSPDCPDTMQSSYDSLGNLPTEGDSRPGSAASKDSSRSSSSTRELRSSAKRYDTSELYKPRIPRRRKTQELSAIEPEVPPVLPTRRRSTRKSKMVNESEPVLPQGSNTSQSKSIGDSRQEDEVTTVHERNDKLKDSYNTRSKKDTLTDSGNLRPTADEVEVPLALKDNSKNYADTSSDIVNQPKKLTELDEKQPVIDFVEPVDTRNTASTKETKLDYNEAATTYQNKHTDDMQLSFEREAIPNQQTVIQMEDTHYSECTETPVCNIPENDNVLVTQTMPSTSSEKFNHEDVDNLLEEPIALEEGAADLSSGGATPVQDETEYETVPIADQEAELKNDNSNNHDSETRDDRQHPVDYDNIGQGDLGDRQTELHELEEEEQRMKRLELLKSIQIPESMTQHEKGEIEDGDDSCDEREALPTQTDDMDELDRLNKKRLEILRSIEIPETSTRERRPVQHSSEEEGEITDSSDEGLRTKKSKSSKKSKKSKKHKKESRKRGKGKKDDERPSKRSRYH